MMHVVLDEYRKYRATSESQQLSVLDVGSGEKVFMSKLIDSSDNYTACDILEGVAEPVRYMSVDLNNESLASKFPGEQFDVVFCLEIIEHLFSPDALLRDLHSVLKPGGVLILSTPNLAYWLNRLLLLAGITPMLMENSSEVKLGRRFKFLGQGQGTEGHIRVFTYTAMLELMDRCNFDVVRTRGSRVWPLPIDKLIAPRVPRLAPDVAYIARRRK